MKTLTTLSAVAIAAFVFSSASAQDKTESPTPQALPMAAPATKVQNTQNSQQNSQNSAAPKPAGTTKVADSKAESAPPVDNKIAVSDPGAPGEKSSTKKEADPHPAKTKKAENSTGVSPK